VHAVLVEHEKYADVSRRFRITKALVGSLIQKVKKNPRYLEEIGSKEEQRATNLEIVAKETKSLLDRNIAIMKASQVTSWVNFQNDIKLTDALVRGVFKDEFGLRYKKVSIIANKSNSERSLVLRQRFGMRLLELL
jgi:hypothetical protein